LPYDRSNFDLFSAWLLPTLIGTRRGKARSKRRATILLVRAGFVSPEWHDVHVPLIKSSHRRQTRSLSADRARPLLLLEGGRSVVAIGE
jgi:hypothetical protein